jgi:hypothetical protein
LRKNVKRTLATVAVAGATMAGLAVSAAPAMAGVYVCYHDTTVISNTNAVTGTTVVTAPLPSGGSTTSSGCPNGGIGVG